MLFEETRAIRAFVGRLEEGDDVIEALSLVCDANDITAARLRLSGTIEDVELVRFDPATQEYVTVVQEGGPFEIVQVEGQLAAVDGQPVTRVNALLCGQGPFGQQLVFGQLRTGRAVDCEFVLETYTDLEIERRVDLATGRFPLAALTRVASALAAAPAAARQRREPEVVSEPARTSAAPPRERREPEVVSEPIRTSAGAVKSEMSWADAMEVSEEIKPATQREKRPIGRATSERSAAEIYASLADEPSLKPGDILDHPKLGECRVIKVEDDDYAHIRLSRGQIRKLALEVIELIYDGERDGKSVFKVRIRK